MTQKSTKNEEEAEFRRKFGLALKAMLKNDGITQKEFAQALGEHPNTITNWVRGRYLPGLFQFKKMVDYLCEKQKTKKHPFTLLFPDEE